MMNSNPATQALFGLPSFNNLCRYFSECSPQPLLAVEGATHVIRYVNPAFCTLAAQTAAAIMGRSFAEVIPESGANSYLALLERVYQSGLAEVLDEQEKTGRPGQYWSYSCWAIYGRGKSPVGLMIQVTDTSEQVAFKKRCAAMNQALLVAGIRQHELTEKAEQLNRALKLATLAKSQFLASMSHEIRTPINVIMGFSELLCMSTPSAAERENFGERIQRQADLLLRLIDDILDLSKVEAGRLEIEKIEVKLPELMADMRIVMQHLAEEKGLGFALMAEDPVPSTILSDPVRLKQILTNIISNAIKFTAAGSVTVTLRVDRAARKIHFTVSDTGSGMTSLESARIFQPFTQADASTTRKFGGTGLGLDLARRLAQALGGDVLLVKTAVGVGSVFLISIALEGASYEKSSLVSPLPSTDKELRLNNIHILVADDGPDNQALVAKYLTLAGACVDLANDGEEAVEMGLNGDYDIILMDIQMPKLNGYEATASLRRLGCKIPIVALTADVMTGDIEKCHVVGCNAHLAKPIRWHRLMEVVHQLVKPQSEPPPQRDGTQNISL